MSDPAAFATRSAPLCPGPDPAPHPPRRFVVPVGAVDTHAHVIGLPPDYPIVPDRNYTAPAAPAEKYFAMLDAVGMTHGVLIQVSVHGTDNRFMAATVKESRGRLRGIAVISPNVPDAEIDALADAGVVGCRINTLFGGGIGWDAMETPARRIARRNWHLQLWVDARTLPQYAARVVRLPIPFVIDHLGYVPTGASVDDPGFKTLLSLLADADCWVKLSGAYRVSAAGPPYADTIPFAQALVAQRPDRLVWGSDWPHVATYAAMPNVGDLLDLLAEWVPAETTRNAILVENAHRLYSFAGPCDPEIPVSSPT
jgi:predicted TIM-barrel fold metal-dependent hydrolase